MFSTKVFLTMLSERIKGLHKVYIEDGLFTVEIGGDNPRVIRIADDNLNVPLEVLLRNLNV